MKRAEIVMKEARTSEMCSRAGCSHEALFAGELLLDGHVHPAEQQSRRVGGGVDGRRTDHADRVQRACKGLLRRVDCVQFVIEL